MRSLGGEGLVSAPSSSSSSAAAAAAAAFPPPALAKGLEVGIGELVDESAPSSADSSIVESVGPISPIPGACGEDGERGGLPPLMSVS